MEHIPASQVVCDFETMDKNINKPRSSNCKRLTRKRSFLDALREKYCVHMYHMNDEDYQFQFVHIVISGIPRDKRTDAELGHLRNVVLDRYNISHAGIPQGGLASLCPNVVDLDLALNNIDSWPELLEILTHLPKLKFLNISGNKIQTDDDILRDWPRKLPCVENLVINSTGITWSQLELLAAHFPGLKELHVCGNEHKDLNCNWQMFPQLECLHLNNNSITSWSEVWKLHYLTKLKTLMLSGNPLEDVQYGSCCQGNKKDTAHVASIQDCFHIVDDIISEACSKAEKNVVNEICWQIMDQLFADACRIAEGSSTTQEKSESPDQNTGSEMSEEELCPLCRGGAGDVKPFHQLHTLCLSGTSITDWKYLHALSKFPNLLAVRIRGIPLISDFQQDDKWMLFVASLPNVQMLNGSEITNPERERAERFFLRHFLGIAESERPERFFELQEKHGTLSQLVDIDLGARYEEWPSLTFLLCGEVVFTEKVHVVGAVGKLRSFVASKFGIRRSLFRIFHQSRYMPLHGNLPGKEELFLDSLPMSRYDFMTGDEIHIVLKQ